jgi:hypothetical protein
MLAKRSYRAGDPAHSIVNKALIESEYR